MSERSERLSERSERVGEYLRCEQYVCESQLLIAFQTMRTCYECARELSTPFNLRRHMRLCHNIDSPLRVGKTKTTERRYAPDKQTGGGVIVDPTEDSVQTDDSVSDASETSEASDGTDATGDATADNEDTEAGDIAEDNEASDDENWVFDRFLRELDDKNDLTLKQRQKLFRKRYADFLVWYHHLRQNQIHKKIMASVDDLKDGPCDYDKEEALRAAVEHRQFLLNRLVEDTLVDDDKSSADE